MSGPLRLLVVLAFLAAHALAQEGGVEPLVRAQRLLEEEELYWSRSGSTRHSLDAWIGSELEDLSRHDEVREWLRKRIRSLQVKGASVHLAERLFAILVLARVTPEDVELVLDLDRKTRPRFQLPFHAARILESAPFAMSPLVEEKLLAPLCDRAAATLEPESAAALWLLEKRLGREKVEAALQAALKKAGSARSKAREDDAGFYEITIHDPAGKPLAGPSVVFRRGSSGPQALVWPDGKVRLREHLPSNPRSAEEPRFEVHGFYELEKPLKLEFARGSVKKLTASLPRRRSRLTGMLKPAPEKPLFARPARGALGGWDPGDGGVPDALCDPVGADGSFAAPFSRSAKPDALVFHDARGRALLSAPLSLPAGEGDLDLGVVEAKPLTGIDQVPIALSWPAGQAGEAHQYFKLHWKPLGPGLPEVRSHALVQQLAPFTGSGPVRVGLARNMPRGSYRVAVELEREAQTFEVDFTTTGAEKPLVLEPRIDPPAATPEKPAFSHPIAAAGRWFRLRSGDGGQVHLLWSGRHDIRLRSGKGEALGPARTLWERRRKDDPLASEVDLRVGPDGDLHLFSLFGGDAKRVHPRYARFSAAGEERGAWIELGAPAAGEYDCWGLPAVIFLEKDVLLTLSPFSGETSQLVVGRIEGGEYQKVRSLTADRKLHIVGGFSTDDWTGAWTHIRSPILLGKDERSALVLLPQTDRLAWSGLDRIRLRPATPTVQGMRDPTSYVPGEGIVASDGRFHLVLSVPPSDSATRSKLWYGVSAPGKTMALKGLAKPALGLQDDFALAEDPRGRVHLFAFTARGDITGAQDGQLIRRLLTGGVGEEPRLTRWQDRYNMRGDVQAVFAGASACVAWESNRRIYLRVVEVEGGGS